MPALSFSAALDLRKSQPGTADVHIPSAGGKGKKTRSFADCMGGNVKKLAEPSIMAKITKTQEDQNLVFGWASVIEENGQPVVDSQGHVIGEADLEKAFYAYAQDARVAGEMHGDYGEHVGKMVECMVFTKAKQEALGIDLGKVGAWVGYRLSPAAFAKVKDGTYKMLSIGGRGNLEAEV